MTVLVTVSDVRVELWTCSAPFSARSASDRTDDWPFWFVTDDGRRNVMRFPDQPGAVLTTRAMAEAIAAKANVRAAA